MPTVLNNLDMSRYEMFVDGQLAGILEYRMENDQIWLMSTEMYALAEVMTPVSDLLLGVLQNIRRRRIEVLPFCPVVRKFMVDNPLFLGLVPEDPPGHFPLRRESAALSSGHDSVGFEALSGANAGAVDAAGRIPPETVVRSLRERKLQKNQSGLKPAAAVLSAARGTTVLPEHEAEAS